MINLSLQQYNIIIYNNINSINYHQIDYLLSLSSNFSIYIYINLIRFSSICRHPLKLVLYDRIGEVSGNLKLIGLRGEIRAINALSVKSLETLDLSIVVFHFLVNGSGGNGWKRFIGPDRSS